jgi:hypothetical protein
MRTTFRRRTALTRAAVAFSAVLMLAVASQSAVAADREPVSFSLNALGTESVIEARGPNHAVIEFRFGTLEFLDYSGPDGRFAANPHLAMTVQWNADLARGHVSGTLSTMHFFDPVRWDGRLVGSLTESGGEGTLHMTEVNTGMKLRATWTIPALDPLSDIPEGAPFFVASGTVTT